MPQDVYPSQWTYHMGWSLVALGRLREAAQEIEAMLAKNRADQGGVIHATRALLRAKTGDRRGAEADIAAAIDVGRGFGHFHHTALTIGEVYAQLGDLGAGAARWVEKAANDGFPNYSFFEVDPHLAPLRATERFRRYLRSCARSGSTSVPKTTILGRSPDISRSGNRGNRPRRVGQTLGGRPRRIARWAAVVGRDRRIGNRRTVRAPTPREHQGSRSAGNHVGTGRKGIAYIDPKTGTNLWEQPLDGSSPRQLTRFDGDPADPRFRMVAGRDASRRVARRPGDRRGSDQGPAVTPLIGASEEAASASSTADSPSREAGSMRLDRGDGSNGGRLHRFAVERFRVSVFVTYTCRRAVRWPRG